MTLTFSAAGMKPDMVVNLSLVSSGVGGGGGGGKKNNDPKEEFYLLVYAPLEKCDGGG